MDVIYTCISGEIDELFDPYELTSGCEYVCFTDRSFESYVWDIRPLLKDFGDPRLTARYHKTKGCNHFGNRAAVWQDGKVTLVKSVRNLIDQTDVVGLLRHPRRNCIYNEAMRAVQLRKDGPDVIKGQAEFYKQQGYPAENGLYETAFVVRKGARELNERWWNEINTRSKRDQISLPYLLWEMNIHFTVLRADYEDETIFKVEHHPWTDYRRTISLA